MAVFKMDTVAIAKLMDENFISIYPHKINNKQQELRCIYKYIRELKNEDHVFDPLYLDDFKVHLHERTAIATYFSVSKGRNKGVAFGKVRMRWFDVWVKRNDKWKMVASQGTSVESKN